MSSRFFVLIDPSSESSSVDDSSIEAEINSYSSALRLFSNYLYSSPLHSFSNISYSSNCAKVIMSPLCSWDYVAYRICENSGCIASASEYGLDVYANALENIFSNTTSCEENIFHVLGMYMRYYFLCCGIPTEMPQKPFCEWWHMFNTFVSTCSVAFCTTQGQNKTRSFDTEGFVPVASLCGIIGSLSWFKKCLIGITGNIWSVVDINTKSIYHSETRTCTII